MSSNNNFTKYRKYEPDEVPVDQVDFVNLSTTGHHVSSFLQETACQQGINTL